MRIARAACAAGLVLTVGPPAARAETEQAVSVGLGYATFSIPVAKMGDVEAHTVSPNIGGALAASYERALGSDVSLRGELALGAFYGGNDPKTSPTSFAALADLGAVYRFDVARYVPYAFGGLGAVTAGGGPLDSSAAFVLVVGGGLDWLVSRERSWGIELRLASFGGDITVFTAGVRGTTRWGFF